MTPITIFSHVKFIILMFFSTIIPILFIHNVGKVT